MTINLSRQDAKEYGLYVKSMTDAWEALKGEGRISESKVIDGLFTSRGYSSDRVGLRRILGEVDLGYVLPQIKIRPEWKDLGLLDNNGRLLLASRYVVPIRDFMGGIIALVGWWDDTRKYITCGSEKWFSKSNCMFGMEQAKDGWQDGGLYICEGIFDTLAMRSCGLRAVGCMGIDMTPVKRAMVDVLSGGSRILAIPDQDKAGNKVVWSDQWGIEGYGGYLRWDRNIFGKDIDDLVNNLGEEMSRDMLRGALAERRTIVRLMVS